MTTKDLTYDVVAIGNAIVDVMTRISDAFLEERDLIKGSMNLISAEQAGILYRQIDPERECSGGSAANTVVGIASLGGTPAFIGKVHADELGKVFRRDIGVSGVEFFTPPMFEGPSTARCIVLVTPDAQRTMNTYLGACTKLSPEDIDADLIKASKVTYLEGYLWDENNAKKAMTYACEVAKSFDRKVALTLSDSFCVERHRDEFLALIKSHVDLLFANEKEIKSLYQTDNFDEIIAKVKKDCEITAITRQEKGSVVISGMISTYIDAEEVKEVVDTTGAGDLYAAGFLYGYGRDYDLGICGRIGGITAAEIITHYGARPEVSLKGLIRKKLGL